MNQKPQWKIVYRPGKTVVKIALLGLLVLSTVTLIAIRSAIVKNEAEAAALEQQAAALEQENQKLQQYNDQKNTDEGYEQVAQNELGMVDPDTVIYDFG